MAPRQPKKCEICLDPYEIVKRYRLRSFFVRPKKNPSPSGHEFDCGHGFCTPCVDRWISMEIKAKRVPIGCPFRRCNMTLHHADVLGLLAQHRVLLDEYRSLFTNCPNCKSALPARHDQGLIHCPHCVKWICLNCKTCHENLTCDEMRKLCSTDREAGDLETVMLARQKGWKRCPGCGFFVERISGCNHVLCRCGTTFNH